MRKCWAVLAAIAAVCSPCVWASIEIHNVTLETDQAGYSPNLTSVGGGDWVLFGKTANAWSVDTRKDVPNQLIALGPQSTAGAAATGLDSNQFTWSDGTPTPSGQKQAASQLGLNGTDINTDVTIVVSTQRADSKHRFYAWIGSKRCDVRVSYSTDGGNTFQGAATYAGVNLATLYEHQYLLEYTPSEIADQMYVRFEWNLPTGVTGLQNAHLDAAAVVAIVNDPPVVNISADQMKLVLPDNAVALEGTVTDSDPYTARWTVEDRPRTSNVTLSSPNSTATTATFDMPGNYLLRLTATDSHPDANSLSASDDVVVKVRPAGFDGLEAHITFSYKDPNSAADSALLYTAKVLGQPGWTGRGADDPNDAVLLDGKDDALDYGRYLGSDPQCTIMAWIRPAQFTANQFVLGKWPNDATGKGWMFRVRQTDGNLAAMIGSAFNGPGAYLTALDTDEAATPLKLTQDAWTHIALTFGEGVMRLYQDGALVRRAENVPWSPADTVTPMVIGYRSSTNREFFAGGVDEVRIYDRVLTSDAIEAIYLADGGKPWATCRHPRTGDLDRNCRVELPDVATLSMGWQGQYGLSDLADLAAAWLACNDLDLSKCR